MGNLDKQLQKLTPKEQTEVAHLVEKILCRDLARLDCKKLKGVRNLFRVRKGTIRIIFEMRNNKEPSIFSIERRNESMYRF